ncbi:MAG: hypothetical protein JWL63_3268 [Rhodocyclales bacterium]|nr:hypothetical protein [Rhodocyclales bacterium]
MDHWTDGYVTELPYSVNHFPEMAPAHLNLALLHLGLASPALDAGFTYLELGFGQGLGLNMLAATHPQGRFFGNDFMPAHVDAAQALASQAGLGNLGLFQDSFAQMLTRDLPPMDYIVLHGVYSWVNAENRSIVVALLHKLLKSTGVVYISYNCLPGWSLKAPMQRLMSEFAQAQSEGSALERFHAARELLGALGEADAAFFTHNSAARSMLGEIQRASDAYLLHEFAPQGWSPFYHTDVARDLAAADLRYAGSAKLFANFPAWSQTPKTRALLAATPDAGLRELLRDFAAQTQFRRDIFVRNAEPLSATDIDTRYRALKFSLWRPRASCALRCQTPIGELQLDEEAFGALLDCLESGPQSLDALIGASGLDATSCVEALNMLLCLEYIGISPSESQSAESRERIQRLNRCLLQRVRAGERISGFASPVAGAGIAISCHDQLFLSAQQDGHTGAEALAAYAKQILDVAAKEGDAIVLAQLLHEARNFLVYGSDFYLSLDLFPARM